MAKSLNMRFALDNGRTTAMSLAAPKDELTREQVEPVMQMVVDTSAIEVNHALPTGIKSAVGREVNEQKLI